MKRQARSIQERTPEMDGLLAYENFIRYSAGLDGEFSAVFKVDQLPDSECHDAITWDAFIGNLLCNNKNGQPRHQVSEETIYSSAVSRVCRFVIDGVVLIETSTLDRGALTSIAYEAPALDPICPAAEA